MSLRSRALVVLACAFVATTALPAAASAATCTVASNGTWSTFDWETACAQAPGYEPGVSDDVTVADNTTLTINEDIAIRDLDLGADTEITGSGAADLRSLTLGNNATATLNGSIASAFTVPSSAAVHLNGTLTADAVTIQADAVIDLHGNELGVVDGGLSLEGTQADGAAQLVSTGVAGTAAVDNLGASLSVVRGTITNVNVEVSGDVRFDVPLDATGLVTNSLTDASIETTTPGAAYSASCAFDLGGDICQPVSIVGTGTSVLRMSGALNTTLNAQLYFDVPVEVAAAAPTWTIDPSTAVAAPNEPAVGTALVRFASTPTRGGALAITVTGPADMTDAMLDIAVGDGFTAIAAPSIAIFTAGNAASDRVFVSDTSGAPHQFMIFHGPIPALTNNTAPVVSGSGSIGDALTTTNGAWSQSVGVTYAYQWFSKASGAGSYSVISGATSSSYTPVAQDAGADVRVEVTARKTGYSSATQASNAVRISGVVTKVTAPALSGEYARVGSAVTATPGTWSETSGVTYSYQWYANSTSPRAVGTDSATFTPTGSEAGSGIWVVVTASKAGLASGTASSNVLTVRHPLPTIAITAPSAKLVEGIRTVVPVQVDAFGAGVRSISCSAPGATVYCDSSHVSVKADAVKDLALTVLVVNGNGESVTKTVDLPVRAVTIDDVFRGSRSITARSDGSNSYALDWRLRSGWQIACAYMPDAYVSGSSTYSQFSPDGSSVVCDHDRYTGSAEWSDSPPAYMSWAPSPLPGTYTVQVPVANENKVLTFDFVITVKLVPGTGAGAASSVDMGGVVSATSPLRCGWLLLKLSVESDPKGSFMWFVDGKLSLAGKDYWELPMAKLPSSKSGTISCMASGSGQAYLASVVLDGGVRVGASLVARTAIPGSKARVGSLGASKRFASFKLRLQASGRKVVRITTYRLVAHKRGTKRAYRYQRAGRKLVTLKKGTRTVPVTARTAAGYKFVVTTMHPKHRAGSRLVPGKSITLVP